MAKMYATEAAQRHHRPRRAAPRRPRRHRAARVVERLYREIRPLRIYEGTSEIQRPIIGRAVAKRGQPAHDPRFPDDFNLADYFLFDRLRRGPRRQGRRSASATAARPTPRSPSARRALRALPRSAAGVPRERAGAHRPARHRRRSRGRSSPPSTTARSWRWATRARRPPTSRTSSTTPAPRVADHHARGRRRARRRRCARAPACAPILLVPDVATGDDPEADRARRRAALRGRARPRLASRSTDAIAHGRARSARARRAPTRRDDVGHLALHLGLDRQAQGQRPHPPRLRVQHRGLRQAHRRLPRATTSPSACRASSSATRPAPT